MAQMEGPTLILASGSPRRLELLQLLGIPFQVKIASIDETASGPPEHQVQDIAYRKAHAVLDFLRNQVILAADTLVQLNDKTLGKPRDEQDAFEMLSALSGRWHSVYTAVCLLDGKTGKAQNAVEKTDVLFAPLSPSLIRRYINTKEPMDKAGAYAIQGHGGIFVQEIRGSYSNVVGLPLSLLRTMLSNIGIDVLTNL